MIVRWIVAVWRWLVGVFDFFSLLEDEKPGSPRRLSQTKIMVWGAMVVGVALILSVNLKGEALTLTETGLVGVLTVAAGLMKVARDTRRHDRPPYDRGDPFEDGGQDD